jgi:hypothetical protein
MRFSQFLVEEYNTILLLEAPQQHQLIRQFGKKIVQKLNEEYPNHVKDTITSNAGVKHIKLIDRRDPGTYTWTGVDNKTHLGSLTPKFHVKGTVPIEENDSTIHLEHPDSHKAFLEEQLEQLKSNNSEDTEKVFKHLSSALNIPDLPTSNDAYNVYNPEDMEAWHSHVNWVLHRYAHGGIESTKDIPKVLSNLAKFHKLTKIKSVEPRDEDGGEEIAYDAEGNEISAVAPKYRANPISLSKWKNASDLQTFLDKANPLEGGANLGKKEYTIIDENKDWHVVIPHTAKAACDLGKGASWCTTSYAFQNYNKDGPLYIMLPKDPNVEKMQMHVESAQFKDIRNTQIGHPEAKYIQAHPLPDLIHKTATMVPHYSTVMGVNRSNQHSVDDQNNQSKGFTSDEIMKLITRGHIKSFLDNHPHHFTPEIVKSLLNRSDVEPENKESLARHSIKRFTREQNSEIYTQELHDNLFAMGHGSLLVTGKYPDHGTGNIKSFYLGKDGKNTDSDNWHDNISHENKIAAIDAFVANKTAAAKESMVDATARGIFDLSHVKHLADHTKASIHHGEVLGKMIDSLDQYSDTDFKESMSSFLNHPASQVGMAAIGQEAAYAKEGKYTNAISDIIQKIHTTKYPIIKRTTATGTVYEDKSHDAINDFYTRLKQDGMENHVTSEHTDEIMSGPNTSFKFAHMNNATYADPHIKGATTKHMEAEFAKPTIINAGYRKTEQNNLRFAMALHKDIPTHLLGKALSNLDNADHVAQLVDYHLENRHLSADSSLALIDAASIHHKKLVVEKILNHPETDDETIRRIAERIL